MGQSWRCVLVAVCFLISSCGASDDGAADTPTTVPVPTSSTTPSASTTPSTSTSRDDPKAEGSGCEANATQLPDGRWFGYVEDATAEEVSFDLACWFIGDDAAVAAAEDGEESPPPNDYYVRNQQSRTRAVPVGGEVRVEWLPNPGAPDLASITFDQWRSDSAARGYQPGVWIDVDNGEIVSLTEQFVP